MARRLKMPLYDMAYRLLSRNILHLPGQEVVGPVIPILCLLLDQEVVKTMGPAVEVVLIKVEVLEVGTTRVGAQATVPVPREAATMSKEVVVKITVQTRVVETLMSQIPIKMETKQLLQALQLPRTPLTLELGIDMALLLLRTVQETMAIIRYLCRLMTAMMTRPEKRSSKTRNENV